MKKSRQYYYTLTRISKDGKMASYQGREKDVVYKPAKPTKWGFHPYALEDSKSG